MRERGLILNIIRPNFPLKKLSKLYAEKYFSRENGWEYYDPEQSEQFEQSEQSELNYDNIDYLKWKKENLEIGLCVHTKENSFVFFYYIYYGKMVLKKLTTIQMWEGNEEKFLSRWSKEVNNYNKCINNVINQIYENAKIN